MCVIVCLCLRDIAHLVAQMMRNQKLEKATFVPPVSRPPPPPTLSYDQPVLTQKIGCVTYTHTIHIHTPTHTYILTHSHTHTPRIPNTQYLPKKLTLCSTHTHTHIRANTRTTYNDTLHTHIHIPHLTWHPSGPPSTRPPSPPVTLPAQPRRAPPNRTSGQSSDSTQNSAASAPPPPRSPSPSPMGVRKAPAVSAVSAQTRTQTPTKAAPGQSQTQTQTQTQVVSPRPVLPPPTAVPKRSASPLPSAAATATAASAATTNALKPSSARAPSPQPKSRPSSHTVSGMPTRTGTRPLLAALPPPPAPSHNTSATAASAFAALNVAPRNPSPSRAPAPRGPDQIRSSPNTSPMTSPRGAQVVALPPSSSPRTIQLKRTHTQTHITIRIPPIYPNKTHTSQISIHTTHNMHTYTTANYTTHTHAYYIRTRTHTHTITASAHTIHVSIDRTAHTAAEQQADRPAPLTPKSLPLPAPINPITSPRALSPPAQKRSQSPRAYLSLSDLSYLWAVCVCASVCMRDVRACMRACVCICVVVCALHTLTSRGSACACGGGAADSNSGRLLTEPPARALPGFTAAAARSAAKAVIGARVCMCVSDLMSMLMQSPIFLHSIVRQWRCVCQCLRMRESARVCVLPPRGVREEEGEARLHRLGGWVSQTNKR